MTAHFLGKVTQNIHTYTHIYVDKQWEKEGKRELSFSFTFKNAESICFGDSEYDPLALQSLLCFKINICICEVYFYLRKNTDFLKIFNLDFMYILFFLGSFLLFFSYFFGVWFQEIWKKETKQCSECVTGMGSFATRLCLLIIQFLTWKEIWLILNSVRGE